MTWWIWIYGFIQSWSQVITATALLSVLLFFFTPYYKSKIEKSIQHNIDKQIEEIRSSARKSEESFKAAIKSKDDQIAAIRSGALSGMVSRYALLDKRRLEANENVWAAAIELNVLKVISKIAIAINMEYLIKSSAKEGREAEEARAFAQSIWEMSGLKNIKPFQNPESERPFLSPIVWALFSTYRQVLQYPMLQLMSARSGIDILKDQSPIIELVKAALPHQANVLEKYGASSIPHMVDELENKLLTQIMISLDGTEYNNNSIEEAAKIIKASQKLASSIEEGNSIKIPSGFSSSRH